MSDSILAKEVFADALDVEPSQREAFIRNACTGDQALIANVLGLIETHEKAKNFLNVSAVAGVAEIGERTGSIIGNYKLRELIGEGGFGSVFLAEQERPVRRRVALKIIKLGMDTRAVVARFEQERQALAVMDHPNIARVLDAGATETGRPYFVMELVKGEPITIYCDKHNLMIDERLELFTQVCNAIQHAHTKGVIHRDLKPNNILVSQQDGKPVARVIDFGIAKATDHRFTEKTIFTEFRQLIGTPEYMSPEQAEGSLDVDTRTDVYSLGVLLYELLTGSTPFDGKSLRSAAYAEMQRIIREVEPPCPSTRLSQSRETLANVAAHRRVEPARLSTMIRGELDWIVMKALDKDRARRYSTPGELASDIRRHIAGEAVTAAPPTRFYRVRKMVARNRGAVAAGLLLSGALVIGGIGTGIFAILEHQARGRAEKAEGRALAAADEQRKTAELERAARARAEAAEAEARRIAADLKDVAEFQKAQLRDIAPERLADVLRSELIGQTRRAMEEAKLSTEEVEETIAQLRELLARPNLTTVAVRVVDDEILERSVRVVDEKFRERPLIRAELLQSIADTMVALGLAERAEGPQTLALEIRRRELGNASGETIDSMSSAGVMWQARGRMELAAPLFEEAYATSRRVLGESHGRTLTSLINLGALRMSQGKSEEAETLQRQAIEMSTRINGESHTVTAGAMANLAFTLGERNKFAEAVSLMERSLSIRRSALGEGHADTLEAVNNLGFMLLDAGRGSEAEKLFREALEGRRRVLGDDHEATIRAINNIGSALRAQGKPVEAEEYFRRAFEAYRRTLGPEHARTIDGMSNLGVTISDAGRPEEAYPYYREVYEWRRRVLGPDHPKSLSAMSNLGAVLDKLDRLEEAAPYVRGAFEARRRLLGPDKSDTQTSQHNYAYLLQRMKKYAEAEPLYADLVAVRRRTLGPAHPRTLNSVHALGTLMRDTGRLTEAESLLKEALKGREGHPLAAESGYWYARTLLELGRLAEAEVHALQVEADLQTQQGVTDAKKKRAVELVRDVYAARDKAEPGRGFDVKSAEWTGRLEAFGP